MKPFDHFRIFDKFDAHYLSNHIASDVILRRAEATADDHGIAAIECNLQSIADSIPVVAHLHLQEAINACERELFTDPRRIRVDDLAEQELGSNSDNFAVHWFSSS